MVSNAILDQSKEGKVATSAAELHVCASAHAGGSRPVPRLSVSTGFHPCLNAESQNKSICLQETGMRRTEGSQPATREARHKSGRPFISFSLFPLLLSSVTLRPHNSQTPLLIMICLGFMGQIIKETPQIYFILGGG